LDKDFFVYCPHCGTENELNLNDYKHYYDDMSALIDKCSLCGNEYLFDIEVEIVTIKSYEDNYG
jgi:hypothetical protein